MQFNDADIKKCGENQPPGSPSLQLYLHFIRGYSNDDRFFGKVMSPVLINHCTSIEKMHLLEDRRVKCLIIMYIFKHEREKPF